MKYLYLVIVAFLFNMGLSIGLDFANEFLNNNEGVFLITKYGTWISFGLCILIIVGLIYLICKIVNIDIWHLILVRLLMGVMILILLWATNIQKFWNIHDNYFRYALIDDEEYYEDPNADNSDPIYGSDNSGSSSTFKYFVPLNTKLEGINLPEGTILKDERNGYYLVSKYEEIVNINFGFSIYWQYAITKGYTSLEENSYKTGGLLTNYFTIGPFYIIEQLITKFGISILFCFFILLINIIWPEFLYKETNSDIRRNPFDSIK